MASLRQRMLEDMQVRQLSACTQRTYVETVARFARYFDRSPARLGPEQIRAYQVYLTNERRLAPSSLVVAVSALRFLYRVTLQKRWVFDDMIPAPKKPRSLPVVLSPEEVVQFLDGVKAAKHHAILTTCYAAGLRISEAVHLTVSAIDSERMVLRIAKGKGQKDRYVMLSPKLLAILWSWPDSVDTYPLGEEEESTMPKSRPPYPAAFRQQMVELVRSGRTPGELAREFEPSAEAIRNWVAQADRDAGERTDGLSTEDGEELRRLRRENRRLREEREILAKATAWFARETGSGRSTGS